MHLVIITLEISPTLVLHDAHPKYDFMKAGLADHLSEDFLMFVERSFCISISTRSSYLTFLLCGE